MKQPLPDRLRPENLSEIVGQEHIFGKDNFIENLIAEDALPNLILYGPPGTGKTTVARIISQKSDRRLFKLNATTASLSDIKNIISEINPITAPNGIILYIDEIQYFNKKQQQSLLEFIENGKITLIASTTENPYFYIYSAILSRSQVFEFKPVSSDDIKKAILRAIKCLEKEDNIEITISDEAMNVLSSISNGDVRKALNTFEICYKSTKMENKKKNIVFDNVLEKLSQNSFTGYNKTGDDHFDLLSAFQKSLRGSDANASIYYLAKLLEVGELTSICRRLLVCMCEDVGLAHPSIFPQVKTLCDIAMQVGLPEARIPLCDAVILVALSPKSNSAYIAINSAMKDLRNGKNYDVPRHLKNVHCDSSNINKNDNKKSYLYPHDFENHWIKQQYLPDEIKNKKYYIAQSNKTEQSFETYWNKIKKSF